MLVLKKPQTGTFRGNSGHICSFFAWSNSDSRCPCKRWGLLCISCCLFHFCCRGTFFFELSFNKSHFKKNDEKFLLKEETDYMPKARSVQEAPALAFWLKIEDNSQHCQSTKGISTDRLFLTKKKKKLSFYYLFFLKYLYFSQYIR